MFFSNKTCMLFILLVRLGVTIALLKQVSLNSLFIELSRQSLDTNIITIVVYVGHMSTNINF